MFFFVTLNLKTKKHLGSVIQTFSHLRHCLNYGQLRPAWTKLFNFCNKLCFKWFSFLLWTKLCYLCQRPVFLYCTKCCLCLQKKLFSTNNLCPLSKTDRCVVDQFHVLTRGFKKINFDQKLFSPSSYIDFCR